MTATYPHLNLRGWPFTVVPSDESAQIWVGRPGVKRRLTLLLRSIRRVDASRIVLFWAAFGAGKTHGLRYLRHEARRHEDLRALYVVTPKGIKSFLDMYRAIIASALADGVLDELGLALHRRYGPAGGTTDLQRALVRMVALSEAHTRPVIAWLKADKVAMREVKDAGLTGRVETEIEGIEILNELIGLLRSELGLKLLLLLDEVQELGDVQPRRVDALVGGLHKVFDRNTEGLTVVFSFTTESQQTVSRIIGKTLYERRSEMLTLPALTPTEGASFIADLLKAWSMELERAPFPFQEGAIDAVVARLGKEHSNLTPRDLIRAFDVILREADLDIEDGAVTDIDGTYALRVLTGKERDQGADL